MSFLPLCLIYTTKMQRTHFDTRSNNTQYFYFNYYTHAGLITISTLVTVCEMCDAKICWHFYSSNLNDRRGLSNEEQMSVFACRTKELDISTMLRPVFPPLLVSAGLAFRLRLIGWSLPFSPTVWTLTCQKKRRTTLTMSFLFSTCHTDLCFALVKFD